MIITYMLCMQGCMYCLATETGIFKTGSRSTDIVMAFVCKKGVSVPWWLFVFLGGILIVSRGVASLSICHQDQYDTDIPVILAIPLLFEYNNCSSLCAPEYNTVYGFHFSSQQYNVSDPGSVGMATISGTCESSSPQQMSECTPVKDSHSYNYHLSLYNQESPIKNLICYQCEKTVFGIRFEIDNPTFSVVVSLFGHDFNQSFAVFPIRSPEPDGSHNYTDRNSYRYDVLFGSSNSEAFSGVTLDLTLDGITIQSIYDETNVTIEISSDVIAMRNAQHKVHVYYNQTKLWVPNSLCAEEVVWMEAMVARCSLVTGTKLALSGTKITSNKPIAVFTNKAMCNSSGNFSYKSQVVHQMPEKRMWGTRFIVDTQQTGILPIDEIQSTLRYNISVLVSQKDTTVTINYYYLNKQKPTGIETLHAHTSGEILHSSQSDTLLKTGVSHIDINATHPVLVIFDINTEPRKDVKHLSYSVLLQPTKWYNNIQTVVLSHPNSNLEYKYHISVVVPIGDYDPNDILTSKGEHFCETTTLARHSGFSGQTSSSDGYIVVYLESTHKHEMANETQLLVRHSNPNVAIGVTVFAYSQDLHYAYSNGFAYNSDKLKELKCEKSVTSEVKALTAGVLSAVLAVVMLVAVSLCYLKRRRCKKTHQGFIQIPPTEEPDPDFYDYDAFLVFMNEDEMFVRQYIFEPLTTSGYKLLWHYDSSIHLFRPGNNVIDDTKEAMEISRKVIFVCTKYFTDVDRQVAYCKDEQARVKKRRILPIVIEEEYGHEHFKKYTQIRLKRRDLSTYEERGLVMKLKQNIGAPKQQQRTGTPFDTIL